MNRSVILNPANPNRSTGLLNGKASGILNWDDLAYPSFARTYKALKGNFWVPEEVSLNSDHSSWEKLTDHEREAFKAYIGMLATLDAPQGRMMYSVSNELTDASAQANLIFIAQQEVVHNQSYSYILSSLMDWQQQSDVFAWAKDDERVQTRNEQIMEAYDSFLRAPESPIRMAMALAYSLLLEGVHFYGAFAFFYNLARQGKMVGASTIISYINKDEMVHISFQADLLRALLGEMSEWDRDSVLAVIPAAVRYQTAMEIGFSEPYLAPLLDYKQFEGYMHYRANKLLSMLGMDEIYEGADRNSMPWINAYVDNFDGVKTDFFEQKVRQYSKITEDDGFDEV